MLHLKMFEMYSALERHVCHIEKASALVFQRVACNLHVLWSRFPTAFAMEKDGAHYSRLVSTEEEPEPIVRINVHDIAHTDQESSTLPDKSSHIM